jgi:NDP-sugar pyrophosphorylase family protein
VRAVVLAAGRGTRLAPLTDDRPKAALEVAGRPLIARVVDHLVRCGFGEIAVNLHYRPQAVRDALADAQARIVWFEERELLGTAGALGSMRSFLAGDDAFLVQYGDVLTDHDLAGFLERHRARDALLTLLVHERAASNSVVVVDRDGRVTRFLERPSERERRGVESPWVNSGVYACSAGLLELLPRPPSDIPRDLVPRALAADGVYAEPLAGSRWAIDSPERLAEATRALTTPARRGGRPRNARGSPSSR